MEKQKIDRINELARLAKTRDLTEAEKSERDALRKEYISLFKNNLKSTLDNASIKNPDGSITKLKNKKDK